MTALAMPRQNFLGAIKEIRATSEAAFQALVACSNVTQQVDDQKIKIVLQHLNRQLVDFGGRAAKYDWKEVTWSLKQAWHPLSQAVQQLARNRHLPYNAIHGTLQRIAKESPQALQELAKILSFQYAENQQVAGVKRREAPQVTPEIKRILVRHLMGISQRALKGMDEGNLTRIWERLRGRCVQQRDPLTLMFFSCVQLNKQSCTRETILLSPQETVLGVWKDVRAALKELQEHQPSLFAEVCDLCQGDSAASGPLLEMMQDTSLMVELLPSDTRVRVSIIRASLQKNGDRQTVINPLKKYFQGLSQEVYQIAKYIFIESEEAFRALMYMCYHVEIILMSQSAARVLENSGVLVSELESEKARVNTTKVDLSLSLVRKPVKIQRAGQEVENVYLRYPLELIHACVTQDQHGYVRVVKPVVSRAWTV